MAEVLPTEDEFERMAEAFDRAEEAYLRAEEAYLMYDHDPYERVEEDIEATRLIWAEYEEEYIQQLTEEEYRRASRYWEANVAEREDGRILPTPIRLEPIFQDQYNVSEDEWDEMWDRRRGAPSVQIITKTNPVIGDIVTFSIDVNIETETKMKSEEFDCPICYTTVCKWDAIHLNCAHVFCGSCVSSHLDTLHKNHAMLPSCALCRKEYALFEIPNPKISSKIEMMLRK